MSTWKLPLHSANGNTLNECRERRGLGFQFKMRGALVFDCCFLSVLGLVII